ncbi:MAG: class B sortase [Clostridia bacterium]|nr:class B sortase [Clostridia bacterium]
MDKEEVKRKNTNNGKKIKMTILYILLVVCIIAIVISLYKIINWFIENNKNKKIKDELSNAVVIYEENVENDEENTENQTTKDKSQIYSIDFEKLKSQNPDTVAWLKVNGTDIEFPVVKANDNYYYLTHSFDRSYNSAGWIFADYSNNFDSYDRNIVIYGHNRMDGSMFSTLKNVLTDEWLNNPENMNIILITENEKAVYEVFSVYQVVVEDYYINTSLFNDNYYQSFLNNIQSRSIRDFGNEVSISDTILTLSTCADNMSYRIVVHAKKVNGREADVIEDNI